MAKGGVGKTTTAVNLACGLAARGKRVVLVDCDTQNQAAQFLGVKPAHGLYEFVTERLPDGRRIPRNDTLCRVRENLWLLSGGMGLVALKNWLGEQPPAERQSALAARLVPKGDRLDYLLFDCAPGWDILSVNVLTAAREVLCPVAVRGACLAGLKTFFRYLQSAQQINAELRLAYVLPTMFDLRLRQTAVVHEQLKRYFARQLCAPIRYNVRLAEAPVYGQSIFEHSPRAPGAEDYAGLVERIMADEQQRRA